MVLLSRQMSTEIDFLLGLLGCEDMALISLCHWLTPAGPLCRPEAGPAGGRTCGPVASPPPTFLGATGHTRHFTPPTLPSYPPPPVTPGRHQVTQPPVARSPGVPVTLWAGRRAGSSGAAGAQATTGVAAGPGAGPAAFWGVTGTWQVQGMGRHGHPTPAPDLASALSTPTSILKAVCVFREFKFQIKNKKKYIY